jgi:hypothetical protein
MIILFNLTQSEFLSFFWGRGLKLNEGCEKLLKRKITRNISTGRLVITGMNPQSKLWKQIPQQVAGYSTLRFAGLFNLPIPLRFAFGIGVSTINNCEFNNF